MTDEDVSQAVMAFVGSPGVLSRVGPADRVRALFGDRADDLVSEVQLMLVRLHSATPPLWATEDLQGMGRNVERWLRENYPGLGEDAVAAVARAYTFDYR